MIPAGILFHCRLAAVTLLLAAVMPGPVAADDSGARNLMQRVFDQTKVSFVARMRLSSPGGLERIIEVRHKQMPKASATYMEVISPFNLKGTRFLSWDRDGAADEHYTYVPMVKRSVQVPEWTLKQSFLGSSFYMVDIAIPDMEEAEYTLVGEGEAEGIPCTQVRSAPVILDEDEPYSATVYCVDVERLISISTEYFDLAGHLLKVWRPERIENVDGVWTPMSQTMTDVQANSASRLEILEIEMHVELPDEIFRKLHLDR
jgi:hypothetical protein